MSRKRTPKETIQKKYEATISRESLMKTPKDHRKITELKNPHNVTVDEEKANEMGITTHRTREAFDSVKKKHREPALNLLPRKEFQNKDTLSVAYNTSNIPPNNDTYKNLMVINASLHNERPTKKYPLEQLVDLGLFTPHSQSMDEKQLALSTQFNNQAKKELMQVLHHPNDATTTATQNNAIITLGREVVGKNDENQNSTNIKISLTLGQQNYSFGYTRYASNEPRNFTFGVYDNEKLALSEQLFLHDPLDDTVPYGSIPTSFNAFRKLTEENRSKYDNRNNVLNDAAEMVPMSVTEYVNREHVKRFRRRPSNNEALCVSGERCYFYTFTNDPDIRYIGQVFYTQKQIDDGEYDRRKPGMCIDCLLVKWTLEVMDNISKEYSPKQPINHFSFIVGEGEYHSDCMLDKIFNGRVTGIVGHVPFYDANHRDVCSMKVIDLKTNTTRDEVFIGEVGMDF